MTGWSKAAAVLAGLGLIAGIGFGITSNANDGLNDQIDDLNAQIAAVGDNVDNLDFNCDMISPNNTKIDDIHTEIFETDVWESEAELLALDEIQDDDYEAVYDYMTDASPNGLGLDIDDEDDIEKVIVKDVKTITSDVDDRDATVEYKLRVYYENSDGDDKKETVYATAAIDDGEVDELTFSSEEA